MRRCARAWTNVIHFIVVCAFASLRTTQAVRCTCVATWELQYISAPASTQRPRPRLFACCVRHALPTTIAHCSRTVCVVSAVSDAVSAPGRSRICLAYLDYNGANKVRITDTNDGLLWSATLVNCC